MDIAFLNGEFVGQTDASLPLLDRSVLFGDGIYEVIPVESGQMIGFELHMERLERNLGEVGIPLQKTRDEWLYICRRLVETNGNRPIYMQVSRGASLERLLGYPKDIEPNVFAFSLGSMAHKDSLRLATQGYKVISAPDIRWQRCDIKSTSMLASTLIFREGKLRNADEVILFNEKNEITEGCAVNIFVVKNGLLVTPPLDRQILSGITRHILLECINERTNYVVEERPVMLSEVLEADEVLLSSSTKNIGAIVEVDGIAIGNGKPGMFWRLCSGLYDKHKLEY